MKKSPKSSEKKTKPIAKERALDKPKAEAGTERFLHIMAGTRKSDSPRKIAEGVKADLEGLENTSTNRIFAQP